MITVYGLTDEHGQIHYVGATTNPKMRYATHRSKQKSFRVSGMAVLAQKEDAEEALAEEAKWIAFIGLPNLVNKSPGMLPLPDLEPEEEPVPILCALESCVRQFIPVKPWQRFHTSQCRDTYHNAVKLRLLAKARRLK